MHSVDNQQRNPDPLLQLSHSFTDRRSKSQHTCPLALFRIILCTFHDYSLNQRIVSLTRGRILGKSQNHKAADPSPKQQRNHVLRPHRGLQARLLPSPILRVLLSRSFVLLVMSAEYKIKQALITIECTGEHSSLVLCHRPLPYGFLSLH